MITVMTPDSKDWGLVREFLEKTGGLAGVDPKRDVLTVAYDERGDICGVIAAKQVVLVHEFRVEGCVIRKRQVAEGMWNYAMGSARAAGHDEGLVVIDKENDAMLRFLGDARAVQYGDPNKDALFLVPVK